MRDFFWGPDVGWVRGYGRFALKLLVSVVLAYWVHEAVAHRVFVSAKDLPVDTMEQEINALLCPSEDKEQKESKERAAKKDEPIDVAVRLNRSEAKHNELSYTVIHKACRPASQEAPAANSAPAMASKTEKSTELEERSPSEEATPPTGKFYVLEDVMSVTHPRLQDSIHVLLRNVEAVWRGQGEDEVKLCAESRKLLGATDCNRIERLRLIIEGERENPTTHQVAPVQLVEHLRAVRWGALLLGPVQFGTLAVFIYAMIETVGLRVRWLWAPSYIEKFVQQGMNAPLPAGVRSQFESELAVASQVRVRAFVDRFLEKALSPSTTTAESRLRNFRDILLDDCVSHIDMLEMLGDTMLKIAFLGTVYGIGSSLFEARNLDAADPLVRLVSKSVMYAGIGMGFGATLVGIALSIAAAKLRTWLATAWMSDIDLAWREATTFYDVNYGGAAVAGVAGVNSVRVPYAPKSLTDRLVDGLLTMFGVIALVLLVLIVMHYGHLPAGTS